MTRNNFLTAFFIALSILLAYYAGYKVGIEKAQPKEINIIRSAKMLNDFVPIGKGKRCIEKAKSEDGQIIDLAFEDLSNPHIMGGLTKDQEVRYFPEITGRKENGDPILRLTYILDFIER